MDPRRTRCRARRRVGMTEPVSGAISDVAPGLPTERGRAPPARRGRGGRARTRRPRPTPAPRAWAAGRPRRAPARASFGRGRPEWPRVREHRDARRARAAAGERLDGGQLAVSRRARRSKPTAPVERERLVDVADADPDVIDSLEQLSASAACAPARSRRGSPASARCSPGPSPAGGERGRLRSAARAAPSAPSAGSGRRRRPAQPPGARASGTARPSARRARGRLDVAAPDASQNAPRAAQERAAADEAVTATKDTFARFLAVDPTKRSPTQNGINITGTKSASS